MLSENKSLYFLYSFLMYMTLDQAKRNSQRKTVKLVKALFVLNFTGRNREWRLTKGNLFNTSSTECQKFCVLIAYSVWALTKFVKKKKKAAWDIWDTSPKVYFFIYCIDDLWYTLYWNCTPMWNVKHFRNFWVFPVTTENYTGSKK